MRAPQLLTWNIAATCPTRLVPPLNRTAAVWHATSKHSRSSLVRASHRCCSRAVSINSSSSSSRKKAAGGGRKQEGIEREIWWRLQIKDKDGGGYAKGPVDGARRPSTGLNRTGKSCRLRWVNYLHPDLKHGRITPQEERLILELHSRWGNRWARIARRLPGRTDNEIKNYWRTHTRKKKKAAQERVSRNTAASSVDDEYPSPEVEDEAVRELDGGATAWFEETNDGWYVDQVLCGNIFLLPDVAMMSFDEEFETSVVPSSPAWEYGPYSLWKIDDDNDDSKAYV